MRAFGCPDDTVDTWRTGEQTAAASSLRPLLLCAPHDDVGARFSTCELVNVYLTSVGRSCNLILNVAPDNQGGLAAADLQVGCACGALTASVCLRVGRHLLLSSRPPPACTRRFGRARAARFMFFCIASVCMRWRAQHCRARAGSSRRLDKHPSLSLPWYCYDALAAQAYAELGGGIQCLWSLPLGSFANLTLDSSTGQAVAPLPQPVAGSPGACPQGDGGTATAPPAAVCATWNLTVVLQEELSVAGQRLGRWDLEGCVNGTWVPLVASLPAVATTAVGHKRIVAAAAAVVAPPPVDALLLTGVRFTAVTAYAWAPAGRQQTQEPPLVLATLAVFGRGGVGACLPANCSLVTY